MNRKLWTASRWIHSPHICLCWPQLIKESGLNNTNKFLYAVRFFFLSLVLCVRIALQCLKFVFQKFNSIKVSGINIVYFCNENNSHRVIILIFSESRSISYFELILNIGGLEFCRKFYFMNYDLLLIIEELNFSANTRYCNA